MKITKRIFAVLAALIISVASLPAATLASAETTGKTLPTPTNVQFVKNGDKYSVEWDSHRNEFTDYGENSDEYYWTANVHFYGAEGYTYWGTSNDGYWEGNDINRVSLDVSDMVGNLADGPYYAVVSMNEIHWEMIGEVQTGVATGVKSAETESNVLWLGENKSEISTAKIENVIIPMFEGETPIFDGQADIFDERYTIECEYWEEVQNGEPVAAVYSDGREPKPLKKIETFEAGKNYIYSVVLKAKKFYHFADSVKLTVNGDDVPNSNVKPMGSDNEFVFAVALKSVNPVTIKEINEVRVNNVTTSYKNGEKPKFTASAPSGVKYVISLEGWDTTDAKGVNKGITNSEYWNNRYNGNLIGSFSGGQKYNYMVVVTLKGGAYDEGYRFSKKTKLYINGKLINFANPDDAQWDDGYSMWYNNVLSFTVPNCNHNLKTSVTKATPAKDGIITKTCTICKQTVSKTTIAKVSNIKVNTAKYVYNGKVKTPAVTVKDSKGKTLRKNTDYTVTYAKGRKNVGKYKVTVTLKGNYSGTKTLSFTIVPKGTKLSSVKAGKKQVTVKWKAQKKSTTGYQIQYSTSKKFKSAKIATVKKNKTTSATIKKLKGGKKYYVRVRTFKTVGKVKYYSVWSGNKNAKVKK